MKRIKRDNLVKVAKVAPRTGRVDWNLFLPPKIQYIVVAPRTGRVD